MQVFGLIGNPVSHSLSPVMHEAAYESLDMDARYVTFEPQRESLDMAIEGASALGIRGLNVTIPYKRAVLESNFVTPDRTAEAIGAVNTIDFTESGAPRGYNTDASGAVRALREHDVSLSNTDTVIIGAGGAGRAIAYGLDEAGASLSILNRTESTAVDLARGLSNASAAGLDALERILPETEVLINATSVGMESDESVVPPDALHADLCVMDAVYSPIETRLLRDAADRGARTIDGAWMLLYQGVEAFERWCDTDAPIDEMNETLRGQL